MYKKKKKKPLNNHINGPSAHFIIKMHHKQFALPKCKIENGSYCEVLHSCRQSKRINIYAKA